MKRYALLLSALLLAAPLTAQIRSYPSTGGGIEEGDSPTLTGSWDFSGADATFDDEGFTVCDDGDPTKCVEFETSSITTGNVSTITVPQGDFTLPGLSLTQSWTGVNSFTKVRSETSAGIWFGTVDSSGTNTLLLSNFIGPSNTPGLFTGSTSNRWIVAETADRSFNFLAGPGGSVAPTAPSIVFHSAAQNTTAYSGVAYYGSAGKWVTTLTESSATAVLTVPVADNTSVAGTIKGKVFASDGADHQARYAELRYVAVNEGDTETCTLSGADQTDDGNIAAITSGTLTYAWTCAGGTNTVTVSLNAVSSLTQTTLSFEGRVDHIGAGEPLPQ
jgi:hypothetical protein